MSGELRTYLTHALQIVEDTGAWIRERRSREFEVRRKADQSFVTEIDLEVERRLRSAILGRWPDHQVLGEEAGMTEGTSSFRWIIDPIDGTMSLRSGVPLFGTILALHDGDDPLLGIIQLPGIDRCYWAARGLGAFCNGRQISTGDTAAVGDEIIATGDRAQFVRAGHERLFDRLMAEHSWTRTYADCFGHGLAFEGAVGAMVDYDLKAWDVAATSIIIDEAGGRFERVPSNDPLKWNVVFGKPAVVEWILERFAASSEQ